MVFIVFECGRLRDFENLFLKFVSFLVSYFECFFVDFEWFMNLVDCGFDFLFCIEFMSDIEKIFGVLVDLV